MSNSETQLIKIADIVIDDEILTRPLDTDKAEEYADLMRHRVPFPAVDVFYDGKVYRLADGRHRVRAMDLARQEGELDQRETIEANVHDGGFREALIFACGANATHGMPRTNAVKVESVRRLLVVAGLVAETNREIARRAGVSHQMVVNLRKRLESKGLIEPRETVTVQTKDGKQYERPAHRPERLSTVDNLTSEQKRVAEQVRKSLTEEKRKKQKPKKPRLSSTDRKQRDITFEFVEDNQTSPIPGDEAVRRWDAYEWLEKFERTRAWLDEAIEECRRGKRENAA